MDQTTEALIRQDNALKSLNASSQRQQKAAALNARINATVNQVGGKSAEASARVFESAGPTKFESAEIDRAAAAYAAFEARVKQGTLEMRKAEAAAAGEASEIARLRAVLDPTTAAKRHMAEETRKLYGWLKSGKVTMDEYRASVKLLKGDLDRTAQAQKVMATTGAKGGGGIASGLDSRGRPSLLGLKPYELQNLSFQINDIFTQLASGTSLTQTLAQQGGQIFQLFPKFG